MALIFRLTLRTGPAVGAGGFADEASSDATSRVLTQQAGHAQRQGDARHGHRNGANGFSWH